MELQRYKVATDGAVTVDGAKAGLSTIVVDAILSPINALSSSKENELVTKREAGIQAAIHAVTFGLVGEAFGQKRARAGKGPILAFLA